MIKEPMNITDDNFDAEVLQAELPVVVDFWAPWCGPCKMIGPILEKLAEEYAGKVLVAKVNTDENQQYAQQYGVQGIPMMIFLNKGQLVHSQVGALPENVLKDLFEQFIAIAEKEPAE